VVPIGRYLIGTLIYARDDGAIFDPCLGLRVSGSEYPYEWYLLRPEDGHEIATNGKIQIGFKKSKTTMSPNGFPVYEESWRKV